MSETASPAPLRPELWIWGNAAERPRMLHTMLRVNDLDASIRFYVQLLGMKQLWDKFDVPVRRVTATFVGFDSFEAGGCLELVSSWDQTTPHTHGTGYGHVAIGAPCLDSLCASLEQAGVELTLKPVDLLAGGPRVAFVKDPDGYDIELIETRISR